MSAVARLRLRARNMLGAGAMRKLLLPGVLLLLLLGIRPQSARGSDDREDLTEEVLSCEEAVAALDECCPNFDPREVACEDHTHVGEDGDAPKDGSGGCGDYNYRLVPDLDLEQSRCIRDMPCDALIRTSACERARSSPSERDAGLKPQGACL